MRFLCAVVALPGALTSLVQAEPPAGPIQGISLHRGPLATTPELDRLALAESRLGGPLHGYVSGVIEQWLKVVPEANPALIEQFRDRDRRPLRSLTVDCGASAGKYLTSAVQVYRLTHDPGLRNGIERFVRNLLSCQDSDGYLGPYPKDCRLTGHAPNSGGDTWDAFGHYHIMLSLLLWHEETGDAEVMGAARRIGNLLCTKFLNAPTGKRLVDTGWSEANLAPAHSPALLYRATGHKPYLDLAKQVVAELEMKGADGKQAGDFVRLGLAGVPFYKTPKPRWESLHTVMALPELYWITGDDRFRKAFENLWWSIVEGDRHNNGGFSSAEQAQGNPYHLGAIETCCTIAWIAMSVEMLRLTGESIVADEIELSMLNSVVGMHSPSGRWATYNTPMDGVRKASAHEIVFHSREGMPEINCCSVNAARGFGMISDWAVMTDRRGGVLNYYGPSEFAVQLPGVGSVKLQQQTRYPVDGTIRLTVSPRKECRFPLRLRIPYWSRTTSVAVNGQAVPNVNPGHYLVLERVWVPGDEVVLNLDMSLHFWTGERECEGKASIYHGPLLLAYDRRLNSVDPDAVPALGAVGLEGKAVVSETRREPILLLEFTTVDGRTLRLCDFGSAGWSGSPYRSWLTVRNVTKTHFAKTNPLRTAPAGK